MIELKDYVAQTDSQTAVICDDEDRYSIECYKLFSKLRRNDQSVRKRIISFGFGDDEYFVQLQAADLFAYVSRAEAARVYKSIHSEGRCDLYAELTRSDPATRLKVTGYFWNKIGMEAHANGMRYDSGELCHY